MGTSDDVQCQYCGAPIAVDPVLCARCETPHHADCFAENGMCTTYACGSRTYLVAATGQSVVLGTDVNPAPAPPQDRRGVGRAAPPPPPPYYLASRSTPILRLLGAAVAVFCGLFIAGAGVESCSHRSIPHVFQKADPLDRYMDLKKGLLAAIDRGDLPQARTLLDQGATECINSRWGGEAILRIAARQGNREMVQLLLDRGARADKVDGRGPVVNGSYDPDITALLEACLRRGDRPLLEHGGAS